MGLDIEYMVVNNLVYQYIYQIISPSTLNNNTSFFLKINHGFTNKMLKTMQNYYLICVFKRIYYMEFSQSLIIMKINNEYDQKIKVW